MMTTSTMITGVLNPGASLAKGEYQIAKVLGQGGFGITYQGIDTKLNRTVAVKEFFPQGCWREGATVVSGGRWDINSYTNAKRKFLQEGETLERFNHPGIVKVFYYFEENNTAYLVMEYLEGLTLGEFLKTEEGKLPESRALHYIFQVGAALEMLHQSQFLHRDIKPDNIMLAENKGRIVLIDFGTAKDCNSEPTSRITTMLTPGYAPLEQYGQNLQYGSFTDIYALGATLYHLLTGVIPISAIERAAGVELKTVRELNPQVSDRVSRAVTKAMEMDVSKRVQSIQEFFDILHFDDSQPNISVTRQRFYEYCADPWNAFTSSTTNYKVNSHSSSQIGKTSWF